MPRRGWPWSAASAEIPRQICQCVGVLFSAWIFYDAVKQDESNFLLLSGCHVDIFTTSALMQGSVAMTLKPCNWTVCFLWKYCILCSYRIRIYFCLYAHNRGRWNLFSVQHVSSIASDIGIRHSASHKTLEQCLAQKTILMYRYRCHKTNIHRRYWRRRNHRCHK